MNKRNPHYDLIVAWAGGAEIQYLEKQYSPKGGKWVLDSERWVDDHEHHWDESVEYRIKPQPHPKQEFIDAVNQGKQIQYLSRITGQWNNFIPVEVPVTHLSTSFEWRIKPEDIVSDNRVELARIDSAYIGAGGKNNVRFTFDGITHQLTKVELI